MSEDLIKAEARTEFGKGAARRIRRADKVPAVIYGHGNDPKHVTLPVPPDRDFDKLTTLSIAPLISRAIREVFEDGSVTSLFDGRA